MGATSENFKHSELTCRCGCAQNGCTAALVNALEDLRALIGKPIRINSAYRCPEHNRAIGGAPASQHMQGKAADISVKGMTASQLEEYAGQVPAIRGIGRADHQGYLHIDVRDIQAKWCYDGNGKHCAYYKPEDGVQS